LKILLWFQGWPCYLPHAIALKLKEKYGVNEFSALVLGYKQLDFLKQQSEIKYDPITVVQDMFLKSQKLKIDHEYLATLEKKYGTPTLWAYPISDRDFLVYNRYATYTHEEMMKIIQGFFKFTIEFLEKAKPDFIVTVPAENMELLVLHEVARRMKIPSLLVISTRTKDRFTVSRDTHQNFERIFTIYDKLRKGRYKSPCENEAKKFISDFRKKGTTFVEVKGWHDSQEAFFKSIFRTPKKTLGRTLHYSRNYYFGHFKNDYMYKNKSPIKLALAELRLRFRRGNWKRSKIFEKPDYREPYVYFPLHVEPETSLSLLAPFHLDTFALAENIAKSLPINYKLYVKEHSLMIGFRPLSVYKRLLKMPNVRLIDPSTNSLELTRNAKLVAVVTSSVGWEALLLKKPVITFGKVFFNKLDMVKKAGDPASLPKLIRDTLEDYKHDEEQLVKFTTAIFEGSFGMIPPDVTYQECSELLSSPDFNVMVDAFAEEMGLKTKPPAKSEA